MSPSPPQPPHLDRELLDAYMLGERSVMDLLRTAVGHLTDEPLGEPPAGRLGTEAGRAERLLQAASAGLRASLEEVKAEHEAAPALARALALFGHREARHRVRSDRRYHTLSFVQYVLDAAWVCLERGESGGCGRSLGLAEAALRGIEPGRYGRFLVAEAEANLWLLAGRAELAEGEAEHARASFQYATSAAYRAGPAGDLQAGLLLSTAALLVARGRHRPALRVLHQAEREGPRGEPDRWWPSIHAGAAWLERLAGRPEAGANRLQRFFGEWRGRLVTRSEWWAARELLAALCQVGDVEEASARLAGWSGGEPTVERDVAELTYLRGVLLHRMQGDPGRAEAVLERAARLFFAEGRGVDAALARLELYRLRRNGGRATEAREAILALREVSLCQDVSPPVFGEIARLARLAARDRLLDPALAGLEEVLVAARAGWGPAIHGYGSS